LASRLFAIRRAAAEASAQRCGLQCGEDERYDQPWIGIVNSLRLAVLCRTRRAVRGRVLMEWVHLDNLPRRGHANCPPTLVQADREQRAADDAPRICGSKHDSNHHLLLQTHTCRSSCRSLRSFAHSANPLNARVRVEHKAHVRVGAPLIRPMLLEKVGSLAGRASRSAARLRLIAASSIAWCGNSVATLSSAIVANVSAASFSGPCMGNPSQEVQGSDCIHKRLFDPSHCGHTRIAAATS
jgi:hypothetical protein